MKKRYIAGICILGMFLLGILYLSGPVSMISSIITMTIYGFIAYGLTFLFRKIFRKEAYNFKNFMLKFAGSLGFSLFFICLILGSFTYYKNEISPAKMPSYTVSNGEKTIIFQGMSHIGTQDFYTQVQGNIAQAKKQGYVLFFEGVRPGTKENEEKFNQIMGVEFDAGLYENFSKIYGVVHQKNEDLLGIENDLDFNVDISIDEVIAKYEAKYPAREIKEREVINAGKEISQLLAQLGERELKLLVYVNQAILNTIISYDDVRESLLSISGNTDIFDVILNDRNTYLVNEIVKSEYDKIFITYGLMHFEGVLEQLQSQDSNWKIISETYLYPIK